MQRSIIPAITSIKALEQFLTTSHPIGIVMSIHASMLARVVERIHEAGKQAWVHLDLLPGISSDEFGAEYVIQHFAVDGIVSTKTNAVKTAKKKGVTAVYRVFLIDSASLEKSIHRIKELDPDYIEFLPALAHKIVPVVASRIDVPIIGGGLIQSQEDINDCFTMGMVAVTISKENLW
jgi:glycerol uptake operon antiterminator